MQNKIPAPGDSIVARCTKCRENTNHIVVAVVGDIPAKVQCNICHQQHKYRSTSRARTKVRRKTSANTGRARVNWEGLRSSLDPDMVKKYSMTGAYKAEDLVEHPTFGIGIVQRVVGPQKVEILFEAGTKLMRCK